MDITTDKILAAITKRLIKEFNPIKIYLFGSRANQNYKPQSDYDFVVVVKANAQTRIENMQKANSCLEGLDVLADVFVYSEAEFEAWKNELNSIPEAAYNLGVELPLGQ